MNQKNMALFVSAILLCGSLAMAQSSRWIHVKVEKAGSDGQQVKVNLPLGLVETVLPMIEKKELTKGKIRPDKMPLTVGQMREIWQTLKTEGDFELASIQDGEMDLRLYKEGDYLYVRSTEEAQKKISVTISASVVDALLSAEGDELDVMAAAKALSESNVGELVRVQDGEDTVYVWIDTSSSME